MATFKKSKWALLYGSIAVVVLFGALAATFLLAGYSLGPGLSVRHPGTITVIVPHKDTHVFLDDRRVGISSKENEVFKLSNIATGAHTVLVAKETFFPWGKNIVLKEKDSITVRPFLAPASAQVSIITENNDRFAELKNKIIGSPLSLPQTIKLSPDNTVALWTDGKNVIAEWRGGDIKPRYFCENTCTNRIIVFTADSEIENTDFYANRSDVIMIAIKDGIYAIELDATGVQNFQPLYVGIGPRFLKESSESFLVLDGDSLKEVAF